MVNRMKLLKSLICLAAFAIVGALALSTPASAAKTSDVIAACKRTPGCEYKDFGKGDILGCGPHGCFDCSHGKCHPARSSDTGKLKYTPNAGSIVGKQSSASQTTAGKPKTVVGFKKWKMGGKH
jgi:hypothetical protein